jgi:hypothetical protein
MAVTMKNVVFWHTKPSSYLTGDTLHLRYGAQPVYMYIKYVHILQIIQFSYKKVQASLLNSELSKYCGRPIFVMCHHIASLACNNSLSILRHMLSNRGGLFTD